MQPSVAAQIRWKLDLYGQVLALCASGGFSLPRFLALVPDRLRLASGDTPASARVPVAIAPELVQRLRRALPPGGGAAPLAGTTAPLASSGVDLRRLLRLAQSDADADPAGLGGWLLGGADALTAALAEIYASAFQEVGRGEGGEETAYLIHLLLLEALRRAAPAADDPARAAVTAAVLDLALESAGSASPTLSARLGYQLAISTSPLSLGSSAEAVARRPLNAYRTAPEAVTLARRVLKEPFEGIDLARVEAVIAERLLADPTARANLAREILAELVRDGLLLLTALSSPADERGRLFRAAASSATTLLPAIGSSPRRAKLLEALAGLDGPRARAAGAVSELLRRADEILRGDLGPLGAHGDLPVRARLSAAGALVLVLDAGAEGLRAELASRFVEVPEPDVREAHAAGRCYRLALDGEPIYRLPRKDREAVLHVDLSALAARAAPLPAPARASLLADRAHRPIRALATRLAGPAGDAVRLLRASPGALVFAGDVVALLDLAIGVRRVLASASGSGAVREVLGGGDGAVREVELELAASRERLAVVEGLLAAVPLGDPSGADLAEVRRSHLASIAELDEARSAHLARVAERALEAGLCLVFGEPPAEVALDDGELGAPLGPSIDRAERGAMRSPRVQREREAVLARAREGRRDPSLRAPWAVDVRVLRGPDLPAELAGEIQGAIARRNANAVEGLAEELRAWLRASVEAAQPLGLPPPEPPRAELDNAGIALTAPALEAFEHGRALAFTEETLFPAALPDQVREAHVFERDLERLRVARRPGSLAPVLAFREAGAAPEPIWELLDLAAAPLGPAIAALLMPEAPS